jgi:hypothetical protein
VVIQGVDGTWDKFTDDWLVQQAVSTCWQAMDITLQHALQESAQGVTTTD